MFLSPRMYVKTENENADFLLRLRYLRHRQTPNYHIRVKAHAASVSILCFYSWSSHLFLAKFQETRFKRTLLFSLRRTPSRLGITQASLVLLSLLRHFLYVFCLCYVMGMSVLLVRHYSYLIYNLQISSLASPVAFAISVRLSPIDFRFRAIAKALPNSPSARPLASPSARPLASAVRMAPSLS